MALKLEHKQAIVAEVNEAAGKALSAVLADYRGLTVRQMTETAREGACVGRLHAGHPQHVGEARGRRDGLRMPEDGIRRSDPRRIFSGGSWRGCAADEGVSPRPSSSSKSRRCRSVVCCWAPINWIAWRRCRPVMKRCRF